MRRVEDCARYAPHAVEQRYTPSSSATASRRPGGRRPPGWWCWGDSFTEGQGVKEHDAYPRVLEGALNASGVGWRS